MDGRKLSEWLAQSGRPTILYCPTWGDLTSFEWFRKGMNGLLAKYRVIVKLELADAVNRLLGQPIPDFGKLNERLYAYQDGLAPQRAHAAISQLPAGDGGPKRKNDYPGRFLAEATASFIET
ncbi:hypothetical protein, partial [Caldibacillus debilis]|uniref:hypothetical protein n=1 Tax=Caldibacillus debilis TaxID=301148 RepID=UPI0023EFC1E1